MYKKIIVLGLLLFTVNSIAFATDKKLTRADYMNQLNKYIEKISIKIDEVYKNYDAKVAVNKESIKKLENEQEKISNQLQKCYQAEENTAFNEMRNGACGHLYGKTTYFKTSSGLVVADDTYALNKCLAKQPNSTKKKLSSCKILEDKRKKIEQDIKNYTNQIYVFENEKEAELNNIKIEAKNKSIELTNACKQDYPKMQLFGYCNDLEVVFTNNK